MLFLQSLAIESTINLFATIVTFVIVVIGAAYAVYRWNKRRNEKKKYEELMKDDIEMHFLVPTKEKYEVKYEKQDEVEHLKDELLIPSDLKDHIFLSIKTKLNVRLSHRYFGFEGEGKKPVITYSNPFRLEGSDVVSWYRDWHGYYHMNNETFLFQEETYVNAFEIETFDKGNYVFQAIFQVHCNEFKDIKEEKHVILTKELKIKIV